MATSTVAGAVKMASSLALVLAVLLPAASGDSAATIYSMTKVPDWQQSSLMSLTLDSSDGEPQLYDIYPLTSGAGLNQTSTARAVSLGRRILGAAILWCKLTNLLFNISVLGREYRR
jgi:hypothetical protein